jgi:hypothetical protein
MFDFDLDQFITDLQIIHVQQTVKSFNNSSNEPFPQIRFVVLRLVGFGVLTVMGFNLGEAKVGDIAIKVTHNGCVSRVRMWVKSQDGASGWYKSAKLQYQFHFTSYLM